MKKAIVAVLVAILGILCCFAAGAEECTHEFADGMCTKCGHQCPHEYDANGVCTICGYACTHEGYYNSLGWCNRCGYRCTHVNMIPVIDSESTEYEWKSSTEHTVRTIQKTQQKCDDCSYLSDVRTSLKNETSEAHQDNNNDGICDICQSKIQEEIKATFDRERMMLIIKTIPAPTQLRGLHTEE